MNTDISPTSSQHDQSPEPMNPSTGSAPGDVDGGNKRRKTITQKEKSRASSKTREEIEARKKSRKWVAKFIFNRDLSSEDEEDLFPGTVITDYDSDGDEMLEMVNGIRHMNKRELAEYNRQIEESKGFDIGGFHNVFIYDGLVPLSEPVFKHPFYFKLAQQALEVHATEKGEKYELLEVIKLNRQSCGDIFYYYTLRLKDEAGCEKKYRVKVQQNWETDEISVLLFEEVSSGEAIGPMTVESGGMETLGKLTCACETNLDRNDPNNNNDKEPPELVNATITDPLDDCKRAVVSIIEEYFTNYSVEAASSDLRVQGFSEFHPYFIKRLVSMTMNRHDKEKEMASFLLWALYADVISPAHIREGFMLLLESADDLSVDIHDAVILLGHFVVRGVVDEILPSAFITGSQKLLSPSSKGYQALQVAEGTYLSASYCVAPREWAWDRASHHTMEELKIKIADILREYVDIGDSVKVCRCVRELVVSFFHHEVVMQGTILAMVKRSSQPLIIKFLKEAAEEGLIRSSQMVKGFFRVEKGLDRLCLQTPSAKSDFAALVSLATFEGWLDSSFHDLADGSYGMGGTD